MSTLYVDDVAGQGGGTETNLMDGLAKARGHFNFSTPATLSSNNVASITDSGTGDYTVNLTNAMASTNEMTQSAAGTRPFATSQHVVDVIIVPSTTTVDHDFYSASNSANRGDPTDWGTSLFGDLA